MIALPQPLRNLLSLRSAGTRAAPSPAEASIGLGHLPDMRRDQLSVFTAARRDHGDVVRLRFGWATVHLLAHPDAIKHVFVDNVRNFDKQTPGFEKLRTILGNGLLTSDGAFWLRQRRIAQPGFSRERIQRFAPVMAEATDHLIDQWLSLRSLGPVDVHKAMMHVALRIAGLTLLSTDFTREAKAVGDALTLLLPEVQRAVLNPLNPLLRKLPTPQTRRIQRAMNELLRVVRETIEERRLLLGPDAAGQGAAPDDLLTMLMQARDEETGAAMSPEQLSDEVMTIFLAGHETTANALSWALLLASDHPTETAAVVREIDEVLAGEVPTAEKVPALVQTRAFIMESMRLYPPAWMIARRCVADDEIGGFFIPGGSLLLASPFVTQRHPDYFPNPELFDPSRFTGSNSKDARTKAAYFPFGMGPRLCIGQSFAMLEAVLIFARLLQRLHFRRSPGEAPKPVPSVTLRPAGELLMEIEPRAGLTC